MRLLYTQRSAAAEMQAQQHALLKHPEGRCAALLDLTSGLYALRVTPALILSWGKGHLHPPRRLRRNHNGPCRFSLHSSRIQWVHLAAAGNHVLQAANASSNTQQHRPNAAMSPADWA